MCIRDRIKTAPDGEYTINDTIVTIKKDDGSTMNLSLTQKWPIRQPRPITKRFGATQPLVTGQRIMDTLFPVSYTHLDVYKRQLLTYYFTSIFARTFRPQLISLFLCNIQCT